MSQFSRCFLLVFCELSVGGLLALAVPPFHEIERGYYKSSGGVFLSAAFAGCGGFAFLWWTRPGAGIAAGELALWLTYTALFSAYLASLWGERVELRARLFALALLVGTGALVATAVQMASMPGLCGVLLTVASTLSSAAILGAVTAGMLIGHWYLIDPGMEIEPFHRCFRYFRATLWLQIGVLALVLAAGALVEQTRAPLAESATLIGLRLVLGPIATLGAAAMLSRVLAIPQTMAATGLFYIATLGVLVGQFLGRYVLFRTGLPL